MDKELNIMIVGVGGQGTLFSSRLLGCAAMECGYDVKVSEVHGMSQRGGSVVTYVRCGENVASPIITKGQADIILAFEQLEAARWLPYLKKGGKMVVNTQKINCMPVITGVAEYPKAIIENIRDLGVDVIEVDALKLALESGSEKTVNVIMIGIMAYFTEIKKEVWYNAIKATAAERFVEMNTKAFDTGYDYYNKNHKSN